MILDIEIGVVLVSFDVYFWLFEFLGGELCLINCVIYMDMSGYGM